MALSLAMAPYRTQNAPPTHSSVVLSYSLRQVFTGFSFVFYAKVGGKYGE